MTKNSLKNIYVVTTGKLHPTASTFIRHRSWGWFPALKEAEEALLRNSMFELGYLPVGIIEEIPCGVPSLCRVVSYWSFDCFTQVAKKIRPLKGLKGTYPVP